MHDTAAYIPHVIFGLDPMWVSTGILFVVYALIISERMNRAVIALLGGFVMIAVGVLDQDAAIRGIDFNTIFLLTGMMILVAISRKSGMFEYLAVWAAKKANAQPWKMLLMLSVTTAVLSSVLDNVTTVLLIVPVTLAITRELKIEPYPFLFAEIFASNIGGTATLIGDPPNILIGSLADLSFNQFVINLAPIIVVILAVQAVMIHLLWGRKMHATEADRNKVLAMVARDAIKDWPLLRQSLVVIGAVMLSFIAAHQLHLEPGSIAMLGAAVLMMMDHFDHPPSTQHEKAVETFNEVEWVTIFFFIGLFMVVHGVDTGGILQKVAHWLVDTTGGKLDVTAYAILWASAVLSAIVDNIPFVATMIPLIKNMAASFGGQEMILPLWWALSLGACLGGNGTLIGASANLTVAGIAERNGVPFRFVTYTLYAFPMMLVSIAIAHVYVWLRYF